ncbi:hypothetical protein B0H11DRAFT_1914884 [Mycena galericulata]|nr:hypothetical protein B0H11DRAFT_1914884 [Mycena galericulata]
MKRRACRTTRYTAVTAVFQRAVGLETRAVSKVAKWLTERAQHPWHGYRRAVATATGGSPTASSPLRRASLQHRWVLEQREIERACAIAEDEDSDNWTAAVVHLPKRWVPPVMSALFGIQASFLLVQMYKNGPQPHSATCPVSAVCGTYLFGHFLIVAARTLILASNIICFPREYAQSNRSSWAQFSTSSNPLPAPQIKFLGEFLKYQDSDYTSWFQFTVES